MQKEAATSWRGRHTQLCAGLPGTPAGRAPPPHPQHPQLCQCVVPAVFRHQHRGALKLGQRVARVGGNGLVQGQGRGRLVGACVRAALWAARGSTAASTQQAGQRGVQRAEWGAALARLAALAVTPGHACPGLTAAGAPYHHPPTLHTCPSMSSASTLRLSLCSAMPR